MARSFKRDISQSFGTALMRLFSRKWLLWLGIPLAALITGGVVMSAGETRALNTLLNLSSEPLYARGVRAKPALALALSVEFPTVGQTYQGNYVEATEYIGYFDATSCYTYDDTNKQFNYVSRTTLGGTPVARTHLCGGAGFSGNFMNWATSSAIDILRYGLTGGDRIVDTAGETVLQRAVLQKSFYNSTNFVAKSIASSVAANALPTEMMSNHTGATVYVANCLNRVYFGTESTGNCDSPGNNANLGTATGAGNGITASTALPSGTTQCATENGTCSFTGNKEVWYGAPGHWYYKTFSNGTPCTNGVFGDPINGTAKICYSRDVPSGGSATPNNVLTSDSFFTTRVRVCDTGTNSLNDPRTDLCTRYPSGNYKPTGNLQKYADTVRVAAFGYLNDSSGGRYGGVLRAPMKYVGAKTYNANFNLQAGANPKQEWDSQTGVFLRNPEGSDNPQTGVANPISGVINYLNQFGRTGATPGAYKTYDPVGELYYETLRYLQGLPPTPQAFSNLTDAFADGYPVYTSWVDPLPAVPGLGNTGDYSCVNTNILTIGDIHTHYDRSLPGYTGGNSNDFARNPVYNLAGNEPNFKDWTTTVGVYEGRTNLQNETSQDDGSYYMAGAAYWAHVQDFRGTTWTTDPDKRRPGMRVKTYIIDVDEYGQSSGSAATRRSSELYLAAKYGGFSDVSKTGNPFLNAAGEPDLTSNWQQDNGDAKTYFLAGNPQAMLEAIKQIFQQIVNQANSIAGAAIDTQALQTGDGDSYQAQFDPNFWSGNVLAKTLRRNPDGSVSAADATVRWDASQLLGARTSAQPRNIVVGRRKEDVSSSGAATNFLWANLDTWAKEALQTPANAATPVVLDSDTVGSNRLSYLRGDRSLESPAGTFRARGGLIGDIVNSGVTYKAEPDPSLADAGYAAFYNGLFDTSTKLLKRKKALYVGANDGMLHSFDAATGNELFAYIPSFVVPALTQLTNPSYIHRAYVDATPVIAEAQLDTSSATTWKTVLVSGAGGGGQGVFALDVTDPSAFGPSKVLWEFTELDDADLGNVVGAPRIVKIRTSGSSGAILYKWYAVVGGGVNSNADDGHFNENGNAALFFLELGKPVTQPWSLGTNYFKVMFTQISHTLPYGMLAFNVQTGPASELVRLYGGDLQGNFWKLNFSSTSQANGVDVNVAAVLTAGGTKQADTPLFTATAEVNGVAAVQPITAPPGIATGLNNTTLVAFGTGKFLEASDISGPYGQAQTFYTLLDDNLHRFTGRGSLIPLTASGGVLTGESFTWGSVNGGKLGWYLDLPNFTSGERQISDVLIRSGQLFFNTVIPAQGGCDPGSGNIYGPIDLVTGIGTYLKSIEGLPGAPMTQDIASEPGDLSPPDSTGRRKKIGSVQVLNSNSADFNAGAIYKLPTAAYGRLSWRQIMNYQELHHNATTP